MSENTLAEKSQGEVQLMGIYLRNVSFETGVSPVSLSEGTKPEIKLELRVHIKTVGEQEEVALDLSITGRNDTGRLLYLLKLQQAVCVMVKAVDTEKKEFFLNTACPQMLYPYVSQMANTLITQAGFPALYLAPIDFMGLYAQQQVAQKTERSSSSSEANADEQSKWASLDNMQREAEKTVVN